MACRPALCCLFLFYPSAAFHRSIFWFGHEIDNSEIAAFSAVIFGIICFLLNLATVLVYKMRNNSQPNGQDAAIELKMTIYAVTTFFGQLLMAIHMEIDNSEIAAFSAVIFGIICFLLNLATVLVYKMRNNSQPNGQDAAIELKMTIYAVTTFFGQLLMAIHMEIDNSEIAAFSAVIFGIICFLLNLATVLVYKMRNNSQPNGQDAAIELKMTIYAVTTFFGQLLMAIHMVIVVVFVKAARANSLAKN
ncbi:hypothetical protein niasHT_027010 [Heterodera trifolii]|uniref:Uncharacterized protein n=1 Tax=Heterodera trifolii TaxID=157864 RepID=A0ABD2K118_9BILA